MFAPPLPPGGEADLCRNYAGLTQSRAGAAAGNRGNMKRKDDFSLENVGGQDLLIPLGSKVLDLNGLIVLNATGRYIWELLAEDRSLDELVTAVTERFDVDAGQARTDTAAFVEDLGQKGWIEP